MTAVVQANTAARINNGIIIKAVKYPRNGWREKKRSASVSNLSSVF